MWIPVRDKTRLPCTFQLNMMDEKKLFAQSEIWKITDKLKRPIIWRTCRNTNINIACKLIVVSGAYILDNTHTHTQLEGSEKQRLICILRIRSEAVFSDESQGRLRSPPLTDSSVTIQRQNLHSNISHFKMSTKNLQCVSIFCYRVNIWSNCKFQ